MTRTAPAFALTRAAAVAGRPFALWRMPGAAGFHALAATRPPAPCALFDPGAPPAFVFADFAEADAARPRALPASVVADDAGLKFFDGTGFRADPADAAQQALAQGAAAPVTAAPGAPPHCTPRAAYEALVARALDAIAAGAARKIVLSRADCRPLPPGLDLVGRAEALARRYPDAFVALVSLAGAGTWITATPETLLRVADGQATTMALAGTQWPDPSLPLAALEWPAKIVEEQGLVALFVRAAFAEASLHNVTETAPRTVAAGHLRHLRSDFAAPVAAPDAPALARLVRALHPTSAVCGLPRDPARAFLARHEGHDRRAYTGFLGPAGFDDGTHLFVNLRCAQVLGDTLCLYVGGGIVAGSEPALEWTETEEKARVIGDVLLAGEETSSA